ncbi:ER lumen protein-retaining receptor 1 [Sciurus carolinensis]|uniref:ER lumen protein-retaining receptor 1 n=1 Tax=Sciurus carolinensis TaxID=30640 RepID=A0AA41MIM9_SCICA|nr:ER lumen protein-retaining receptor 1 [Sciurus carolinensis]
MNLWTFSLYLESVTILPQLFMVSKTGEAETILSHYLFVLGVCCTLYLFNWIWRYHLRAFVISSPLWLAWSSLSSTVRMRLFTPNQQEEATEERPSFHP